MLTLGRFGRPEEIATARILMSSDASYVADSQLAVDGDMS